MEATYRTSKRSLSVLLLYYKFSSNKLSDDEVSKAKREMDSDFEINRIKPGDKDFVYDKQIELLVNVWLLIAAKCLLITCFNTFKIKLHNTNQLYT